LSASARSVGAGAIATAVLLSAVWGANIVAIKITFEAAEPMWSAFWRMLLGLPVLALWPLFGGARLRPEPSEWRWLMILGVLFGFQIVLLNISLDLTSAAYCATLFNAAPIFTNLLAHFYAEGDRLSRRRVIGLIVAFGGVGMVLLGKPDARLAPAPLLGNLLAVSTAMLVGVRMVYTKRLVKSIDPTRTIFWQVAFSVPVFLAGAALFEDPSIEWAWRPALAMLYCSWGAVGIAFIVWARLIKEHPPGLISVFVFPTPLFGVLFSALLFGEALSAALIVGAVAVALGILIVTWERQGRETVAVPVEARKAA